MRAPTSAPRLHHARAGDLGKRAGIRAQTKAFELEEKFNAQASGCHRGAHLDFFLQPPASHRPSQFPPAIFHQEAVRTQGAFRNCLEGAQLMHGVVREIYRAA